MVKVELAALAAQVPGIQAQLEPSQLQAGAALEEYGHWLEKDLLPRSTGGFRLGEEKYRQKLRLALESDLSMEEIIARARAALTTTPERIYQIGLSLYRRHFPWKTRPAQLHA